MKPVRLCTLFSIYQSKPMSIFIGDRKGYFLLFTETQRNLSHSLSLEFLLRPLTLYSSVGKDPRCYLQAHRELEQVSSLPIPASPPIALPEATLYVYVLRP